VVSAAPGVGVSPTPEAVLDLLRTVPEPCSLSMACPTDIVSMGLVDTVDIHGGRVDVCLVLTDPSCVHFAAMRRYISDVLVGCDGVDEVAVTMSTSQLWDPHRREPRRLTLTPVASGSSRSE
jgi:metal-sulfur cluster biosynthetic enzyme